MVLRIAFLLLAAAAAFAQKPSPVKTDAKGAPRDHSATQPVTRADPAILTAEERPWVQMEPGLRRKVWFNDRQTMVLLEFTRIAGKPPAPVHYHPHDQMSFVVEGRIRAIVDGKTREIGPGGVFIAPSNVRHGIEMVTDKVVLLDAFTPTRDDFRP